MDDIKFKMENFPNRESALLFIDWFIFLAKEYFPEAALGGHSAEYWDINISEDEIIKISMLSLNSSLEVSCSHLHFEAVRKITASSSDNIKKNTPTPGCWWTVDFTPASQNLDQRSMLHMLRHFGTFKQGPNKLRMASSILLEIKDESISSGYPKLYIYAFVKCAGAAHGPFSKLQMKTNMPIIGAIISTCFGTALDASPFFSIKDEEAKKAEAEISSDEILELGFHGLPIASILENMFKSGAEELAERIIGAMMAYESGMLQRTDHATILFFICAIEALTVPNLASAKTQRLSKRFSYFLETFCTDSVDEAMNHANFKQAFGNIKNRKKFINELYSLRSKSVHTGYFGNYSWFDDANESIKVAIINDIVVSAIAALLKQPVTLLWGHPEIDPSVTICFDPKDHQKLQKKAKNHHKNPEDYAKYIILKNIN